MHAFVRIVLLSFVLIWLGVSGCSKKRTVGPVVIGEGLYQSAERHFNAGRYVEAIQAYEAYLSDTSRYVNRESALYHLAVSYLNDSGEDGDYSKVVPLLQQLSSNFPGNPYMASVQVIGRFLDSTARLRSEVAAVQGEIQRKSQEIQRLHVEISSFDSRQKELKSNQELLATQVQLRQRLIEELSEELKAEKEKVQQLSSQLERLKQIDIQKPPPLR